MNADVCIIGVSAVFAVLEVHLLWPIKLQVKMKSDLSSSNSS